MSQAHSHMMTHRYLDLPSEHPTLHRGGRGRTTVGLLPSPHQREVIGRTDRSAQTERQPGKPPRADARPGLGRDRHAPLPSLWALFTHLLRSCTPTRNCVRVCICSTTPCGDHRASRSFSPGVAPEWIAAAPHRRPCSPGGTGCLPALESWVSTHHPLSLVDGKNCP